MVARFQATAWSRQVRGSTRNKLSSIVMFKMDTAGACSLPGRHVHCSMQINRRVPRRHSELRRANAYVAFKRTQVAAKACTDLTRESRSSTMHTLNVIVEPSARRTGTEKELMKAKKGFPECTFWKRNGMRAFRLRRPGPLARTSHIAPAACATSHLPSDHNNEVEQRLVERMCPQ